MVWISGFTFDRQQTNQKTTLEDLELFCCTQLEKEVSQSTLSRLMEELGFTSRLMQVKTSGFQVNMDSATDMALEWLE
jgi:arginine repressor